MQPQTRQRVTASERERERCRDCMRGHALAVVQFSNSGCTAIPCCTPLWDWADRVDFGLSYSTGWPSQFILATAKAKVESPNPRAPISEPQPSATVIPPWGKSGVSVVSWACSTYFDLGSSAFAYVIACNAAIVKVVGPRSINNKHANDNTCI